MDRSAEPGAARAPGPSLNDQLGADPTPPPAPLLVEAPVFLGDEDLPYDAYTSSTVAEREYEHLWSKVWQWACHVDHIPEPGDYSVYDVGPYSALIVRTEADEIKAFHNACMHRGTQLRPPDSCGWAKQLTCPFHGWTFSLDGRLVDLPGSWDFPHVTEESHRLAEMPVGVFAGFVFVNFDPDAEPLEEYLGVLPEHFDELGGRWPVSYTHLTLPTIYSV